MDLTAKIWQNTEGGQPMEKTANISDSLTSGQKY